jgi:uncharacterized protein involved in exopolysaccharide biosynthesis
MNDSEGSAEGGGGLDPELIKSYLNFFRRALRARRVLIAVILAIGLPLTFLVYKYAPRTYTCTTVLMVDGSQVLEGNYGGSGLLAADSLIMRHENLEQIVRDTGLLKKFHVRRPPLLALKDRIIRSLFGEMNDEILMSSLVGTLEVKLGVKVGTGTLTTSVDWTDGVTAAELSEAARESFVKTRHTAEMSAFEEKLTILDGHATGLRNEIETLAKQARTLLEERANNARAARAASAASSAALADAAPRPRPRPIELVGADAPRLKEELERKSKQLADYNREYEQRVQTERRKLEELKLRLTPSHPEVVTQERRLATTEQVPSDIALLRAEVQSMEGELKQRDLLTRRGSPGGGSGRTGAAGPDPLPGDIVQLLDAGQFDPALAAQLSSAISKYAALRDEIRNGRIQFDTAQAAFNFRYKVVVPADPPSNPTKPKAAMLVGGGLALSLLLALLLPILLELRTGLVVERWQVSAIQLPVLADLRLPAAGGERESGPPTGMSG